MIEILKFFFKTHCLLNEEELSIVLRYFKSRKVTKNTLLLFKGEICNHIYFVNKGVIRTYFVSKNSNEKTRFIAFDGSVITALSSFISQKPSFEYIEVLESGEVWSINYHDFNLLKETLPNWAIFYTKVLESAYMFQNYKIEHLMTLSAKERFENVISQNPQFLTRLPNSVFASYLDISQETLSRIKSM
ncbi:MAG: Crp/Fnr family transcriptional regulator [Mucilaginibacter sp.]